MPMASHSAFPFILQGTRLMGTHSSSASGTPGLTYPKRAGTSRAVPWLFAAILLGLAAPPSAQAGTRLSLKFRPGEAYVYVIEQKTLMDMQAQGQQVRTSFNQTMEVRSSVRDVDPQGFAHVVQTIERVRFSMDLPAPLNQTVTYDSATDQEPANPVARAISAAFHPLIGCEIGMRQGPLGQQSEISIPDVVKEAFSKSGGFLAAGGDASQHLEKIFQQSTILLPDRELSVGDQWESTSELTAAMGKLVVHTTYTYDGPVEGGLEKISAKLDLTIAPAENSPIKVTAKTKEAGGQFLFDNAAGQLRESQISHEMELDLGGVGRQTISTHSLLKLRDDVPSGSTSTPQP
jgi:hypothetical protein